MLSWLLTVCQWPHGNSRMWAHYVRYINKVYEKVILSQLLNYIEKSDVYNPTQSGFHRGHLTITLLLKFRNDIRKP